MLNNVLRQLNFPSIGTLYGTHMFVERNNAVLRSATTESAKLFWKSYHNRHIYSLNILVLNLAVLF